MLTDTVFSDDVDALSNFRDLLSRGDEQGVFYSLPQGVCLFLSLKEQHRFACFSGSCHCQLFAFAPAIIPYLLPTCQARVMQVFSLVHCIYCSPFLSPTDHLHTPFKDIRERPIDPTPAVVDRGSHWNFGHCCLWRRCHDPTLSG